MPPAASFHAQLASIMEVLANTAVAEICELVDSSCALLQLEISRGRKENEVLRRKLRLTELRAARAGPLRAAGTSTGPLRAAGTSTGPLRAAGTGTSAGTTGTSTGSGGVGVGNALLRATVHHHGNGPRRAPRGELVRSRPSNQEPAPCRDPDPSSDPRPGPGPGPDPDQDQVPPGSGGGASESIIKLEDEEEEAWTNDYNHSVQAPPPPPEAPPTPEAPPPNPTDLWSDSGSAPIPKTDQSPPVVDFDCLIFDSPDPPGCSYATPSDFDQKGAEPLLRKSPDAVSGGRNFVCTCCGKTLACLKNLKTHMRVHTGEKPFVCALCGKRFSDSSNLKRHQSVHTGEKRYGCAHCGKRFAQSGSLKVHMTVHSDCKQFSCDICGKTFISASHLRRHIAMHGAERQFNAVAMATEEFP